jgi:hypothetical protein
LRGVVEVSYSVWIYKSLGYGWSAAYSLAYLAFEEQEGRDAREDARKDKLGGFEYFGPEEEFYYDDLNEGEELEDLPFELLVKVKGRLYCSNAL